jgi:hypothetical protein
MGTDVAENEDPVGLRVIRMSKPTAALFPPKVPRGRELQAAYARSRQVTEFRLHMEAMDRILPNVKKILLGSRIKINNAELWLGGGGEGGIGREWELWRESGKGAVIRCFLCLQTRNPITSSD